MKLFYLCLSLLAVLALFRVMTHKTYMNFISGEVINVEERVHSIPRIEKGRQIFDMVVPGKGIVRVIAEQFPRIDYGEKIFITGKVSQRVIDDGRIVNSIYFPKIEKRKADLHYQLTGGIRSRVKEAFTTFLPATSSSLLMGIVFGGKQGLPQDFVDDLQTSGVMHVVAASGMNVTFFSSLLFGFWSKCLGRRKAILFSCLGIVWYAVLAGLEPSIVRASIMAVIAFSAQFLGRQQSGSIALLITACIMLAAQPELVMDVGFQLSLFATAGILFLKPLLTRRKESSFLALFKEDIGSTIAAQIMTMPLILLYFHSIGTLSVIVNALVLWTIPLLMVIGSMAAFLGFFMPFVGGIISLCALPFLWYFQVIIEWTAPFNPVFSLQYVPIPLVIGYYLIVGSVILGITRKLKLHEVHSHL